MTQAQFGATVFGVTDCTINNWETGRVKLPAYVWDTLACLAMDASPLVNVPYLEWRRRA